MKFLSFILLSILLYSCDSNNLSESDRLSLETDIFIHRTKASLKYNIAAIKARESLEIKYYNWEKKDSAIALSMDIFNSSWNKPYDIKKDSTLTVDQYLKYCKANNYDPITYADVLIERPHPKD